MITFTSLIPHAIDYLGYLPLMWDEADPRKAVEQVDTNYAHGGGWSPMSGWTYDPDTKSLKYPGDPVYHPVARYVLHGEEEIIVYPHAWVAIVQIDGAFEVARMD